MSDAEPGGHMTPQMVSDSFGRLADGTPRVPRSRVEYWINFGFKLATGRRLKLPTERIGRRLYVAPADLAAFRAAITTQADAGEIPAPVETPSQERRRMKRSQAEAAALLN